MVKNMLPATVGSGDGARVYVIIVAAGTGNRYGGDIPKQFALLNGKPVVMHAIDSFRATLPEATVLLVLSPSETARWAAMCADHTFESPMVVEGGATRTESVRNALAEVGRRGYDSASLVLVHDGARPLVSRAVINATVAELCRQGVEAVVPFTPITDSLMTADTCHASPVDRNGLVAVQTPQAFRASTLIDAYDRIPADASATDDATVAHRYGGADVHLVPGDKHNIKITYPLDIEIAGLYMLADK